MLIREHARQPRDNRERCIIGTRSIILIILKGVTIGDRAVIGAGSVVTQNVPPDCVVAGNPARIVKTLSK